MQKKLYLSLIFTSMALAMQIITGASSSSSAALPQFNKSTFEANAELLGNKTANLTELATIAGYLNHIQSAKTFAVPPFFGISSPEIIAYLEKMPYQQTTVWAYILEQWQLFTQAQPQDSTLLTDNARAALTNIRKALAATEFNATAVVNEQNPERHEQLKMLLENALTQNNLLMVRSTGREDGKELSNAGGNASIASVAPTNQAISDAIKEVLQSYFSEKSIGQRLLGKDKKLFDTPFMAVLLQVMMGEIYGVSNEIPKSGVMFSPEAEGETPGVVLIQATFGHNEGVVNGLVPVDSYYVGPSNIIHPVISIKSKRLAALPNSPGLEFVENDSKLQRISTLDPETVLALKQAAQFVQSYYNNAVDIEFVIIGNTIYFVQARPLENKKFEASYLKNDFIAQNTAPVTHVTPIGIGNGAVRIIERAEQVIITDNIRQALDTFLFKTSNQDAIQAVIINEPAPATSHEATQFRRLGKPVLYAQDLNTIKTWLIQLENQSNPGMPTSSSSVSATTTQPVLIDAQRAIITPFTPTESVSTPQAAIELGWYAHPIAKKVSLMPDFFAKLPAEALRELAPEEFFPKQSTTQLIEIMKHSIYESNVIEAAQSLLHRVLNNIKHMQQKQLELKHSTAQTDAKILDNLMRIFLAMTESAYELYHTITKSQTTTPRLERLYPITFLEALVRQLPEPNRLVNDYSFVSLLKTELIEQDIAKELNTAGTPFREYIVQYAKAGESALIPELKEHWNTFLKAIALIPDQKIHAQFAQFMFNLAKLDVISLWLNTSFDNAFTIHKENPKETAQALLAEYTSTQNFMETLQKSNHFFSTLTSSGFEDPAVYSKQWPIFEQEILALTRPSFLSSLEETTQLGKLAALQVMNTAVTTFDTSI